MSMRKFDEIWGALDSDARLNDTGMFLARLVRSESPVRVFLATEQAGRRLMLCRLSGKWTDEMVADLPKWKGLTIEQRQMSLLEYKNYWFLILSNTSAEHRAVFQEVVSSVGGEILGSSSESEMYVHLRNALQKWHDFFQKNGLVGLSPAQQRGLFGELWMLRELLRKTSQNYWSRVVQCWIGPDESTHDFSLNKYSLEIKTTTAKKHHIFHVAGERQLDNHGLKSLKLIYLVFAILENSGETLPDMVKYIRHLIAGDVYALNLWENLLLKTGYLDAQHPLYKTGYIQREIKCFHVVEGFPRILTSDIPDGVGDISYSVQVSSCAKFDVDFDSSIRQFVEQLTKEESP